VSGASVRNEWAPLRRAIVGSDALAAVLAREGVEVSRTLLAAPRDALFVVGEHIIEGSLRPNARRSEGAMMRHSIDGQVATVPPGSTDEVDGPYLEGGDVIVTDTEVYIGMSGNGSDLGGIDWLAALLGPARRVIPMAMRSSVRHLEDILALLRPGLLVQCRPLLVDGLPRALRDWQSIDLAPEEKANLLVLDENRAVVDAAHVRLAGELRACGVDVITIPLGGGLRAAHCALWRA
jgi:N-dimethylarginine dimethylaminohydrolase